MRDRSKEALRPIRITPNYLDNAEGSALVEFGHTRVICTASFEQLTPKWLKDSGKGWVTAEYGMLPRSTNERMKREKVLSGGRTHEISRLVGRSLRAAVDLRALDEKQILVDCDVINADGGTRTAAVTGGFVALALACERLLKEGKLKRNPLVKYVSAVSVGFRAGQYLLDLDYHEDSQIDTDMNFVVTSDEHFVEIQGTAEQGTFTMSDLQSMSQLALKGCRELHAIQASIVGGFFPLPHR